MFHTQPPQAAAPPAGRELECPSCGTVVRNQDFCVCGEYLAWELTLAPAAAGAAPAVAYQPPAPADLRDSTLLTLRDPARDDDDPSAAVTVSVIPGAEVTVLATVRNQGQIVDTYDVRVDGIPDTWWTIAPATVFLNPWGSSGDFEQQVQVRLHPPRTPEAQARDWPLTVVARSRSLGADVASAPATLTVQPFQSTVMRVGPERRRGRRHAAFDVAVANHGNSPMEIVIGAKDSEDRCPVTVAAQRATVPVGESAGAVVRVGVPRPLIFGRPIDHHLDITHHATGVESDPTPQRVTFRQRSWLPWWLPPVAGLLAAFTIVILLLGRDPVVPKLEGDTVEEAVVVLKKKHLKLGRTAYARAADDVPLGTIVRQEPAAGADVVRGERVDVTLAAPPQARLIPRVEGHTLAEAAAKLDAARFGSTAQPPSAGNDWVVIRQDPAAGTKQELGTKITLAVEQPAPAATPTPTPTATPTAEPSPAATPAGIAKQSGKAKAKDKAKAKEKAAPKAGIARKAALPSDFVFAGATSGQLYRWASADAKAARLTSPKYRLETPTHTDDGYVAVHVDDEARRLVGISADGKTVAPIAEGDFHRPAYAPSRGLLAVISSRGRTDAGKLCVLEPLEPGTLSCARTGGRRVGRPSWAANGRSVLVLAAGGDGEYNRVLGYTAHGGDAKRWELPTTLYRAARIQSAAWAGNQRVAVLVADRAGAPAHLRLLSRRADGRLQPVKDFPALTGCELAAAGGHLALRRGDCATRDGAMVLLDVDRAQPRLRGLSSGVNPAWAG